MAGEILNCWGYLFSPEGEELGFVLDFSEVFCKLQPQPRGGERIKLTREDKCVLLGCYLEMGTLWDGRGPEKRTQTLDEYFDELDLEDDGRLSAQAIELIRSFCLCNLEIRCNEALRDCQFVTMHRLVQEIIRLNMNSGQLEYDWLSKATGRLSHPTFRKWSLGGSNDKFRRTREHFTQILWNYVEKYDKTLLQSYTKLLANIWEDSCPDYLPQIEETILEKVDKIARQYDFEEAVLIQKYILHNQFLSRMGYQRNKTLSEGLYSKQKRSAGDNQFGCKTLFLLANKVSKEQSEFYDVFSLIIKQMYFSDYYNLGSSNSDFLQNSELILFRLIDAGLDLTDGTDPIPAYVMHFTTYGKNSRVFEKQ